MTLKALKKKQFQLQKHKFNRLYQWDEIINPDGYRIIEVTVPRKSLEGMYYNQYLDAIAPAYNSTVPYINFVIIKHWTVK